VREREAVREKGEDRGRRRGRGRKEWREGGRERREKEGWREGALEVAGSSPMYPKASESVVVNMQYCNVSCLWLCSRRCVNPAY